MSKMLEPQIRIDTSTPVITTRDGSIPPALHQAHEIILHAIADTSSLRDSLYLKGGTLMGFAYNSPRRTTDMDFSYVPFGKPDHDTADNLRSLFDTALERTAKKLGYADMIMRVQSIDPQPPSYLDADFPALKFKIAYAKRGTNQAKQLEAGSASAVARLDISFNEQIDGAQELQISEEKSLLSYSLADLVAEKYRALLQQPIRKRNRRQDVYDLNFLLRHYRDALYKFKPKIHKVLVEKCLSRDLPPLSRESIDGPEVRERAGRDWDTLKQELGRNDPLPDFDPCFETVASFYRQLPWAKK